MKTLAFVVLLASVCCAIIPIYGQEKSPKESLNGQNPATQQSSPSPSPRTAKGRPAPINENASPQQGYFSRLVSPESLPNLVLCFIGAAGVIAALYTLGKLEAQVDEMRAQSNQVKESVALAKDTAERQLRAYVCVDSALLSFPQPGVPEARVDFRNFGQTPAYDVRGWIHTWSAEHPLNEVLPPAPADLMKGSETLGPDRLSIFITPTKPPLPPQFLKILGTPKFTFYVYGELRYKDVFGKERVTKYRLMHGGPEPLRKPVRDKEGAERYNLRPDTEGNESD